MNLTKIFTEKNDQMISENLPNHILFFKFCKLVYSTHELDLSEDEKSKFESLREQERIDYETRKYYF